MGLSKDQRKAVIEFLIPLLNDLSKRQMHMDLLFAGESCRPDLDLSGPPRETTTKIVLQLETYSIDHQTPALVELLEQTSHYVGVDQQALIKTWQAALLTPASQPPSVGAQHVAPAPKPAAAKPSRSEQFSLPAPFKWITIPMGLVTLESKNESYIKQETTFEVPSFAIGKYPITLSQYNKFIDAGGYETKEFWTQKGWKGLSVDKAKTRERKHALVKSSQLRSDYPVLATWYEASAFCTWLWLHTASEIFLPTEQQWQRAAQGEDDRRYPWGNEWKVERCNNRDSYHQTLTLVDQYEGWGPSPYGVVDMVGNAAEWTSTNWWTGEQSGNSENPRVVRGGSYQNQHLNFYRVTTRHKEWPTAECGFRIVRLLDS